jgi:uncharacterized membrane protein
MAMVQPAVRKAVLAPILQEGYRREGGPALARRQSQRAGAGMQRFDTGRRLASIDMLRGMVIVIMALDHARDIFHASGYAFDPLDADRTTGLVYLTRLVTHLCAPTFILLAGVSAWLQQSKGKGKAALSQFLLLRGLWLIFLEATVVSFGWAFSLPYLVFLQVIWAIGWAMIALAGLVWLPRRAVLAIGVLIVAGHDLLDGIAPADMGRAAWLWTLLQTGGAWPAGPGAMVLVTYPVLAWIGVMALGYGMAPLFLSDRRGVALPAIGAAMLALFLPLRFWNIYGDPRPWLWADTLARSLMHFFDVEKYPPSLLYVLMTLGTVLMLAPLLERWHGRFAGALRIFGSVPLFAYVLHIYVLHAINIALLLATGRPTAGTFDQTRNAFMQPALLAGSGFPLPVVYAVWLVALAILYPLCRRWSALKARNRSWWMSYL